MCTDQRADPFCLVHGNRLQICVVCVCVRGQRASSAGGGGGDAALFSLPFPELGGLFSLACVVTGKREGWDTLWCD